jgi:putative transposase
LNHKKLYQRWSLDFIADTLSDGRRFRISGVVNDFSDECLACVVDTSLSGVRIVRELQRLTGERTTRQVIVSDNGSELTRAAILLLGPWSGGLALHRTGQPGPERFHRELQIVYATSGLNEHLFGTLDDARQIIEACGFIIVMRDRIRVWVR